MLLDVHIIRCTIYENLKPPLLQPHGLIKTPKSTLHFKKTLAYNFSLKRIHWRIFYFWNHNLEHKQHMLESHQDLKLSNVEDEKIMNTITLKNNLKSWNRKIPFIFFVKKEDLCVQQVFFYIFQFLYMFVYNLPTNTMCIIQFFIYLNNLWINKYIFLTCS
jgi:hypothetical protein